LNFHTAVRELATMPFYEYRCDACGHQLEALQKISDAPLLYCPECGEARLKKLVSKSAFRLKGAGWYATDFKNSGAPQDKAGGGESEGAASKGAHQTAASNDKSGDTKKASKTPPAAETMKKSA